MPRSDELRVPPYRTAPVTEPREPWLERIGWGDDAREQEKVASSGAIVAVHIAWGDQALAITHLAEDGDCDPWHAVGAGAGEGIHVAVQLRSGGAVFFFADDPASRVEGPAGEMALDALREEGLVTRVSADRFAIAMEPGVIYRTRRFGLTATAEIVARPAPLAPPKRLVRLAVYAALFLAAFAVGAAGNALGEESDPMLEAHADRRDEETLARLLAEAAVEAGQRPMFPSEASHAAPERCIVSPFAPIGSYGLSCIEQGQVGFDFDGWTEQPLYRDVGFHAVRDRWGESHPGLVHQRSVRSVGALSRDSIARVLRRNVGALDECVPTSEDRGLVGVRFIIGGDGLVLGAAVTESSLADTGTSHCMARAVRGLVFSAPPGGGVVTVSTEFAIGARANRRDG